MRESETFGSEKGSGEELVQWLNDEAIKRKMKFEARSTSDEYVEEAAEDMVFIKHFGQIIL